MKNNTNKIESNAMTLGTFCSGMGAPEAAGMGAPLWQAEIDKAASNFLAKKFSDVPNLGDITAPDLVERIAEIGIPDLVVAGLPCQPFSVAGLRRGEEDPRNLTVKFVEIMDAIDDIRRRSGQPPVWWLVENVPGLLFDKNNAFGSLLAGMVGGDAALVPNGRWTSAGVVAGPRRGAAWRVLDAQYFGVAQRRRRVFILARGGAGNFDCADALLPITESLRWHSAPRREAWQEVAGTLTASSHRFGPDEAASGHLLVPMAYGGGNCSGAIDVAATLRAHGTRQDFEVETFVASVTGDRTHALGAKDNGLGVALQVTPIDMRQASRGERMTNNRAPGSSGGPPGCGIGEPGDPAPSLTGSNTPAIASEYAVRRLTPTECLRLQGFPDDWFDGITYRGKPLADGPKYKMIGNSMAVPVMRWIGERIGSVNNASA